MNSLVVVPETYNPSLEPTRSGKAHWPTRSAQLKR